MNAQEICRATDASGICIAAVMKGEDGKMLIYGNEVAAKCALEKLGYAKTVLTDCDGVPAERTS